MKFQLHYSTRPAPDFFPVFMSEHPTPAEAIEEAVRRFGFLDLDRCKVKVIAGEGPDYFRPIKICAVCNRLFAGYGRLCADIQHSRREKLDAYGATNEDEI